MWKKLFSVGAALIGIASEADAFGGRRSSPVAMPGGVLQAYRSSAADPWGIGRSSYDFTDPIFATPLPPGPGRVSLPRSGPLAAPVITPLAATNPGHFGDKFEVYPVGWDGRPTLTKHPERHLMDDGCNPCEVPTPSRCWTSFDLLYWATQGTSLPPIVTTGTTALPPGLAANGINAIPAQGGGNDLTQFRTGFRTEAGYWFDPEDRWGISARFYFLGALSNRYIGGGNGRNVINVPQSVVTPTGLVSLPLYVGYPGLTIGQVNSVAGTNFIGGDASIRHGVGQGGRFDWNLLAGYRFLHLGDNVDTTFNVLSPLLPGAQLVGSDSVRTRNYFNGGQVGFSTSCRHAMFTFELQSTIAFGATTSVLDVDRLRAASTPTSVAGFPIPGQLQANAALALGRSNTENYFAVVPEVGMKFGWQPTEHIRFTAGYDFVYWSRVRRAEPLYLPGSSGSTDFWAQGISSGFELRY